MIATLATVFLFSLGMSFILTKYSIPFFYKIKLLDDPRTHKHPAILHTTPTPRSGGVPLFLAIWTAAIFFVPHSPIVFGLFLASLVAAVVGVIDDRYDLSPLLRFGINILCVIIVILFGIQIPFITYPLQGIVGQGSPIWHLFAYPYDGILHLDRALMSFHIMGITLSLTLAHIITILWVVWLMNMLNWSKGVDGQMPGTVAIAAIIIGILSLRFPYSEPHTQLAAVLSFAIAGASLGFLPFNFPPAKIYPGYSTTAMYFLLACVSFLASVKLATAILVLAVPFVDGMVTVLRRVLTGHSPVRGDKRHAHHLLMAIGLKKYQIVLIYWTISIILGIGSLFLSSTGKLFAIGMVIAIIGGGICYLLILTRKTDA